MNQSTNAAAPQAKAASNDGVSQCTVLEAEREQIKKASSRCAQEGGFLGLALSGGGIRSATFGLGVLQALAERRLLSRVDYLSTVSGGGYIGSWLSALTHHRGDIAAVEQEIDPRTQVDRNGKESDAVVFLRRFSNYLTPQTGLLSSDTLSGVATYVRNLLLTQAMIVGVFVLALLVPRLVPWIGGFEVFQLRWPSVVAMFIAAVFINLNLSRELVESRKPPPFFARQAYVLWLILVPLILAAWLLSVLLLRPDSAATLPAVGHDDASPFWARFVESMLAFGVLWLLAWAMVWGFGRALVRLGIVRRLEDSTGARSQRWFVVLGALLVALAVGVGLLSMIRATLLANQGNEALIWHWTVWSVPVLLGVFGLASILLIGLVGREFAEEDREWWSRLGAWLIAGAAGWFVLCAASIYGPFAIMYTQDWMMTSLSLAWVVSTVAGVLAGRSRATGGSDTKRSVNLLTAVAPYLFVVGLLLALSFGIHVGLIHWMGLDSQGPLGSEEQLAMSGSFLHYVRTLSLIVQTQPSNWIPVLLLSALILLLIWRLDINLFSFHMFYRNRLVRCYLGASNPQRDAHPFTGLDPDDNVKLTELPRRPFHILNTAINLTKVNNLAWQERKAASFVLTREYCGYDLPASGPGEPAKPGYQRSDSYLKARGWLSLGQAMTISGAAVSPNQGYHSSKAIAFLLAVFNVRLGWWMQNPAKGRAWAKPGPRFGLRYLLSEVFGLADENSDFVYLSDGGHFENLGIYELVRRQCRFVIAVDAGMDSKFHFQDLGNAVRKCQVDFGVRIDIDPKASIPVPATGKSLYHCAVGRIHYEDADPKAISGFLLYIKPSLSGEEPADIMQYALAHPEFPHQSTADQWFDESQFEAYRKLGHYIATTVLEKRTVEPQPGRPSALLDLFIDLSRRWYRPSARVEANFTKHAERLARLQDTIREQKILHFLDGQIFHEWDYLMRGGQSEVDTSLWLPQDAQELRAGFYFCLNLLELMQDVYIDLNLDAEYQHPDNRGWMNLFKHFAWAGMLRATYAVVCSNFGARFQRFCDVRLGLSRGEVEIDPAVKRSVGTGDALRNWTDRQIKETEINFVEAELIYRFENPEAPARPAGAPRFDKLHRVRLVVPGIRRGRGQPADSSSKSDLIFPVGVALTQENAIVFFRIRDHLRNMGLGREALRKLYAADCDALKIDKDAPDAERIEYLFYSIKGSK